MKVKELIEKLNNFNPEMQVVVDGYETGYDAVQELYIIKAFKNDSKSEKAWYDGDYSYVNNGEHPTYLGNNEKIPGEVFEAVYIPRNS